jgi:hypothetical protein
MKNGTKRRTTGLALAALLVGAFVAAPLAAAEPRTITIKDWSGRGFAPEVVAYEVPAAGAERLRVRGPDGRPLPVQLVKDAAATCLLFPAELPKDAEVAYVVSDDGEAGPPEAGAVAEGDALVLGNGRLAVRLPQPQDRSFAPPVEARTLPAPILAFRGAFRGTGGWMGSAAMLGTAKVAAFRVVKIAAGPVRAEARYELDFAGGGTYRATVRVDAREPLAEVREEYDLEGLEQDPGWKLDLAAGWRPQQAEWIRAMGNGGYGVEQKPLAEFAAKAVSAGGGGYEFGGSSKRLGEAADAAARHVCRLLAPDSNWSGDQAHYVGLSAGEVLAGFLTLHKGDWRRANNLLVWSVGDELSVQMPIGVRPPTWLNEITSERSPLSMHEHDPALPATYGRRVWGLQLAPVAQKPEGSVHGDAPFFRGKVFYGIVGLDRYKDYVLDWPDTQAPYPRVFIRPDELGRMKKEWQASAVKEGLAKLWSLSGDEQAAQKELAELKKRLPGVTSYMLTTPAMGHHHQYNWLWVMADDLLAWPGLPAADRAELRGRLALAAHLYAEGDVTSKGCGTHHGNPNMGVARQYADAPLLAALLPDHPLAKAWGGYWADWCGNKMGHMMSAGGAWTELGSAYQMHAFTKVNRAQAAWEAMQPANLPLLRQRLDAGWRTLLEMVAPVDPRVGSRVLAGIHNSPPGFIAEALEGVAAVAPSDPALAANLEWLWQATGADTKRMSEHFHPVYDRPWVKAVEPALASTIIPGVGVVFRAHQGPDESWMFLRGGYHWSHSYPDQGSFNFVSRGSILVPWQPYQYYWADYKDFSLFNTVRLGDPRNEQPFAWPDQTVSEHAFGAGADYARVSIGFPAWYITPGVAAGFGDPLPLAAGIAQQEGDLRHERQVVFVKGRTPQSPTYAVFRDSFTGAGRLAAWWNLNLLGDKAGVQAKGREIAVATEFPLQLDLTFVQDAEPELALQEDRLALAHTAHWNGVDVLARQMAGKAPSPNWIRRDGKPADFGDHLPDREKRVILRLAAQPGEELHWLLFPRATDEPPPAISRLAPGVVKVVHREGTDWIFTAPGRLEWQGEGIAFKGSAGCVRQCADGSVGLQLLAGSGEVSWQGAGMSGVAPLERTIAKDAPAGIEAAKPAASTLGDALLKPGQGGSEHLAAEAWNEYARNAVTIRGGRGAVRVLDGGEIRFSAPDATLVELICGPHGVRGMGPFDLTVSPQGWSGTVDGARRTLMLSTPETLVRPMLLLDGNVWASGSADEPSPWRGRPEVQFSFAAGVEAGPQRLEVAESRWLPMPPAPARAKLGLK